MTETTDLTGVPKEGWIQIANGRIFYPLDPRAEDVFIEDIAQGLSRQIRYNGQSDLIINVAQHSCNCVWIADVEGQSVDVQLAMLMHDAAEYIVGDLIRPIKAITPGFSKTEDAVMAVINERFDLPVIDHKLMKHFDNLALAWEKRDMYQSAREWPGIPDVPSWCLTMVPWTSARAEHRFLQLFSWLQLERQFNKKATSEGG